MTTVTEDVKETTADAAEQAGMLANGALAAEEEGLDAPRQGDAESASDEASVAEAEAEQSEAPTDDKATRGINPMMGAVALMLAAPQYRHLFLADLEWRLPPPLALKQFRFFVKDGKPVGLVTWALLSEEVVERLKSESIQRLKPEDWRSGKHFTIVDVVAPNGGGEEMREAVMRMAKKAAEGGAGAGTTEDQ